MKKLFASIIAALAFAPVVANAASYTVGEYLNFAGNDSDWTTFNAAGTDAEYEDYISNHGVGTLYVGTSNHTGYLISLSLVANETVSTGLYAAGQTITTGTLFNDIADLNRAEAVKPYGYATNETTGIDVSVASLNDIKAIFGVNNVGDKVNLTDKNLAVFKLWTDSPLLSDGKIYFFTSTETATSSGTYYAIEVTKAGENVTNAELVTHAAVGTFNATLFSVIEMNEEYVCSKPKEEKYVCYECTTTNNEIDYQWRLEGSQAENCKKSTKITSKAKCAKNPKTGVDSYLIPSAIVLGVCAIVLTVVKRKDAFKAI